MVLFAIIILISLNLERFAHCATSDCVIDNRTPENDWENQLQADILNIPEINDAPCTHTRGIEVEVRFALKYFNFDSNKELFSIYSWLFVNWNHDQIKWDPTSYGGLNATILSQGYMWYPRLRFFNGLDSEERDNYFVEPCEVSSAGHVSCVYRLVDKAICVADFTDWPYDTQSCSVKFGLWENENRTVRLKTTKRAMRMVGADYGAAWDIVDYKQEENQAAKEQLTMTFVIERHAETLAALLIYPSIALTTLSITSFALDVRRMVRFAIVCFNMGNHFYFLSEIAEDIPQRSSRIPRVLMYYRGSMFINMFIVLLTYILGVMCRRDKVPPSWITYVNDTVFNGRGKLVVWPKWDPEDGTNEFAEQWTNFANVINNFFFVIIIVLYICLYGVYMPQPPPLNY